LDTDLPERVRNLVERIDRLGSQPVEKPVLVYFDIVGICWPIRCLLHLKAIDYELIRIPLDAWIYRSPDGNRPLEQAFRNGHVPLYVDSEVYLTQSNVILYHLANRHALIGDTPAEQLAVMDVMAHGYDALFHWTGLFQVNVCMNVPAEVVDSRLRAFMGQGNWGLVTDGYRRNLKAFERYLDANSRSSGGYMVGSRLSVADLHAFNVLCNWYKAFDRERFVADFPKLEGYIQHIGAMPGIRAFIQHHQERTVWFPMPELALRLTAPEELVDLLSPAGG